MRKLTQGVAVLGAASLALANPSPAPPNAEAWERAVAMLRIVHAVCPIAVMGTPPATDAISREVSYAIFDPDPLPINAVSREVSVMMFQPQPGITNAWSREQSVGPPLPFEPHPEAWSRELSVMAFQPEPSTTSAWSREQSVGPPPPFEPKPQAWSREVSVMEFKPDSGPRNAWSREQSVLRVNVLVGTVTFGDIEPERSPRFVTILVKDANGNVIRNANVGLINHQYQIKDLPSQVLFVSLKPTHWLRREHSVDLVNGSAIQDFLLINGDIDRDNEVGPGDFAVLSATFGSAEGDPEYDPDADLDADGEVGPSDFSILSANFGMEGD